MPDSIHELSAVELQRWLQDKSRPLPHLVDVREQWEWERAQLAGSEHVPMRDLPQHLDNWDFEQPLVLLCHHGMRSLNACHYLQQQGFTDLYNLSGGIDAWSRQIDSKIPTY